MTTTASMIREGLSILIPEGAAVELRALGTQRGVVSGYFDDLDRLAQEAARLSGKAAGVYVTANPVKRDLLARAANRTKGYTKFATGDGDIERRVRLFIDLDPVRPSDISATEDEHRAALERGGEVESWLVAEGWPEPVVIDSGNGAYLVEDVDLQNDKATYQLIKRCLQALDLRFSDRRVVIDTGVGNAARLIRVPGTVNAKGDDLPERPHRTARVIKVPHKREIVTLNLLERLASLAPEAPKAGQSVNRQSTALDLEQWIEEYGLQIASSGPYQGGRKWVPAVCPWNPAHTNRSAFIIQFPSGAVAAGCLHNGCRDKDWHDLREAVEPGWRERWAVSRPGSANCANSANDQDPQWEPPIPFHELTPDSFPTKVLPEWLERYVSELATATQTPLDLAVMVALAAISTAAAKKVEVEVKPGYVEPVNIYTLTAMEPGNRKSAVFTEVTIPLRDYEEQEARRFAPEIAEAQALYKIAEARLRKIQEAAASAKPDERLAREEEARRYARELAEVKIPAPPRLIADDISPERVATLLRDNNGRIALLSSEGDIFDVMAGRYSRGTPNFGVFLKGHSGDDIRVDRVNRPAEYVKGAAITMGLTVQPEVLLGLIEKPGFRGRGLLGRFFYSLPTSLMGHRDVTAQPMSAATKAMYRNNVRALLDLPFTTDEQGDPLPHRMRLTPDALRACQEFQAWLEPLLGPFGELAHMTDWAGKLAGGVTRVAGLLHVAAHAAHPAPWRLSIEAETMQCAIRIGHYLIAHARTAYSEMGADPVVEAARFVLGWIRKQGRLTLTFRDIFEGTKARFKKTETLNPPVRLLVDHNFIRERATVRPRRSGRRPSTTYEVNPYVLSSRSHNSHNSRDGGECSGNGSQDREAEVVV